MNYGTEPNPSGVKKLVQVSEEFQKPVHVPVVLGNECFIITQQDMRKIEDVRLLSYHKLGPNGELIPVDAIGGQNNALRDAIMNAARFHHQSQGDVAFRQLLEVFGKYFGKPKSTKASIAQQMEWASSPSSTSPAYPLTYSTSTSTNEMPRRQCCPSTPCHCNCAPRYVTNQGSNTMEATNSSSDDGLPSARQKLKLRKITEDTMGI